MVQEKDNVIQKMCGRVSHLEQYGRNRNFEIREVTMKEGKNVESYEKDC